MILTTSFTLYAVLDGEQGIQGLQGLQGERGEQGIQGPKGEDGQSQFFHIKYSKNSNGNPMTEDPSTFIGTRVDSNPNDSTNYLDYDWHRLEGIQGPRGERGIPGVGIDGKTSYLHIKYSNDGGKTFTPAKPPLAQGESPGDWIGQYTDFEIEDKLDVTLYTWSHTKGEKGDKGDKGDTGGKGDKGEPGKDAVEPNPNLLHATSFVAKGLHSEKWNVRITAEWEKYYDQDVHWNYAEFDDLDGGLYNTKYLHALVTDGVEPNYINLAQQCIINSAEDRKVKKSTWYTLSFWVRGKVVVYIYSTEKSSERVVDKTAYVDGIYSELPIDAHVVLQGAGGSEWKKHTITFKTTQIDYKSHILFRMFTTPESYPAPDIPLVVDLCCIKLEEGKDSTPWCRSVRDMTGAGPRYPIWKEGEFYLSGVEGEDFYDVPTFGEDANGKPQHYLCKKTLDVPSKLGENDPVTSIMKHLGIWELTTKHDLVLAQRISADRIDTDNLVCKQVITSSDDGNRTVKLVDGFLEIFGKGPTSNIRIGLDGNGCAILEFYDKDGIFQYGLGPSQIGATKNREARWNTSKLLFLGTDMSAVVKAGKWKANQIVGNTVYTYTSAIIANINQDLQNDGATFVQRSITSSKLNGIYTREGPKMMAMTTTPGGGTVQLPNKHQDNNPVMSGEMYMRTLIRYTNGKVTAQQPVYWSSRELTFDPTVPPPLQ